MLAAERVELAMTNTRKNPKFCDANGSRSNRKISRYITSSILSVKSSSQLSLLSLCCT